LQTSTESYAIRVADDLRVQFARSTQPFAAVPGHLPCIFQRDGQGMLLQDRTYLCHFLVAEAKNGIFTLEADECLFQLSIHNIFLLLKLLSFIGTLCTFLNCLFDMEAVTVSHVGFELDYGSVCCFGFLVLICWRCEFQGTTTIGYGSPNKANSYSVHGAALWAKEVDATRQNLGWE